MAELRRISVREQLGAGDPAVTAPDLCIRLLDPAVQCYVTRGTTLAPNTVQGTDPALLWLAPDRALFVASRADGAAPDGFVSDVTDGFAVFEISGGRAADIVSMSCTLPATGAELAPGRCAQTVFGGVKVLLYRHDDAFRLHVERQFAAFLLEWFNQAAAALA